MFGFSNFWSAFYTLSLSKDSNYDSAKNVHPNCNPNFSVQERDQQLLHGLLI